MWPVLLFSLSDDQGDYLCSRGKDVSLLLLLSKTWTQW